MEVDVVEAAGDVEGHVVAVRDHVAEDRVVEGHAVVEEVHVADSAGCFAIVDHRSQDLAVLEVQELAGLCKEREYADHSDHCREV